MSQIYKYRGLRLDNELKFKVHTKGIIKNVAHKVYLLAKIRKCLTIKAAQDIYKTTILPLIDVGDQFYDCTPKSYLSRLQSLQNRALRIIYRLGPRENTSAYQEKMNLLQLEDRRSLRILQLMDWLVDQPGNRDDKILHTRSHENGKRPIKLMCPKKETYKRSFVYKGGRLWNTLPVTAHTCRKPIELKRRLIENMQVWKKKIGDTNELTN